MDETIEDITLTLLKIGSDKTNYNILRMLPNKICRIMNCTNLTKGPINNRINKLEMCGLVKRNRGSGDVIITDLGDEFIEYVQGIMSLVHDNEQQFIKRFINR